MKKIKNKNLFTLLEVLVSMGIFSLLMLALMQFFSAAQGVWEKSGSKSELFDSARTAAQLLTDDLTAAFYGDVYHTMGDAAADKYIFYKTETDGDSKVHLTFAAQRGGANGLTAVNYVWNPSDLTLSVQELAETDGSDPVGKTGWVTYPSNSWITAVRGKTANALAENILLFNVRNYYYNNSATPPDDDAKYRPPALVLVTFAVLSSSAYEKLDSIIKSTVPAATDSTVKTNVKSYFDGMLDTTNDKFKAVDAAVTGTNIVEKQIIFDDVQFFKLIIPVER